MSASPNLCHDEKEFTPFSGHSSELESSLISERVKAGMAAAKSRGKTLGRPKVARSVQRRIEHLAKTTDLSINKIRADIGNEISRAKVGQIVKKAREES